MSRPWWKTVRQARRSFQKRLAWKRYQLARKRGRLHAAHSALRKLLPIWWKEAQHPRYAPTSEPTSIEDLYKVSMWCGAAGEHDRSLAARALDALRTLLELAGEFPEALFNAGVATCLAGDLDRGAHYYSRAAAAFESTPNCFRTKRLHTKHINAYCAWASALVEKADSLNDNSELGLSKLIQALGILVRAERTLGPHAQLRDLTCAISQRTRELQGQTTTFERLFSEGRRLLDAADGAWHLHNVSECQRLARDATSKFDECLPLSDCDRCRSSALYNRSQAARHRARTGRISSCLRWARTATRGYRAVIKYGYEPHASWARDALTQLKRSWAKAKPLYFLLLFFPYPTHTKET